MESRGRLQSWKNASTRKKKTWDLSTISQLRHGNQSPAKECSKQKEAHKDMGKRALYDNALLVSSHNK